jgi:biopolymer transport protein ExbB
MPDISSFDSVTLAVFGALGILSFLAVMVTIFKFIQFIRLGVGRTREAEAVVKAWLDGRVDEAMRGAAARRSVLLRVLQAVFSGLHDRPEDQAHAEELGRQTAMIELTSLGERMRILEAVVQAAPMLGLLGTVVGMINAFSALSMAQGAVDPALLAGGIWVALSTTAVGLAIALVTYFITIWLESRIDSERAAMEALISIAIHGKVDPLAGRV